MEVFVSVFGYHKDIEGFLCLLFCCSTYSITWAVAMTAIQKLFLSFT
jgi:hypothetical protein